jgi:hypothetical protein
MVRKKSKLTNRIRMTGAIATSEIGMAMETQPNKKLSMPF